MAANIPKRLVANCHNHGGNRGLCKKSHAKLTFSTLSPKSDIALGTGANYILWQSGQSLCGPRTEPNTQYTGDANG
jgi:hypothetical protein